GADTALLGTGDDTFQWDPGDGSDSVEGQGGHDTLAFNGSNAAEKIELSANGPRLRLTRDIAGITTDTDGIDTVNLRTLGSTDTATAESFAAPAAKPATAALTGYKTKPAKPADTININGTAGNDKLKLANDGDALRVDGLAAATEVTGGDQTLDNVN